MLYFHCGTHFDKRDVEYLDLIWVYLMHFCTLGKLEPLQKLVINKQLFISTFWRTGCGKTVYICFLNEILKECLVNLNTDTLDVSFLILIVFSISSQRPALRWLYRIVVSCLMMLFFVYNPHLQRTCVKIDHSI